jgi:hypothetical protein
MDSLWGNEWLRRRHRPSMASPTTRRHISLMLEYELKLAAHGTPRVSFVRRRKTYRSHNSCLPVKLQVDHVSRLGSNTGFDSTIAHGDRRKR